MACRGVLFSLSSEEVQRIRSIEDEDERVDYLHEVVEEEYLSNQPNRAAETDKAWDAMHRVLADGDLTWEGGEYPLNHVVLGGELLTEGTDFIMVLKTPEQVRDVAAALPAVSEQEFRRRYLELDPESYGMELSDDDFEYTWQWFQGVRVFWLRAASEGRYVLFTVAQ
jgi:hypothetical protein